MLLTLQTSFQKSASLSWLYDVNRTQNNKVFEQRHMFCCFWLACSPAQWNETVTMRLKCRLLAIIWVYSSGYPCRSYSHFHILFPFFGTKSNWTICPSVYWPAVCHCNISSWTRKITKGWFKCGSLYLLGLLLLCEHEGQKSVNACKSGHREADKK